jgi:hypothetical protein
MLPAGASLQGSTNTTNLALGGTVGRLVTTGTAQLRIHCSEIRPNSKMKVLSMLSGPQSSSADTVIETLSSNLRISPEGIRADVPTW